MRSKPNKRGRGISWLAIVPIVALLAWLASSGRQTQEEIRVVSHRAVRVAELRETIGYLNEWLAALAQVAVASGEIRWADRYDEVAPKLDDAIAEAVALATPAGRAALASTMGEAHRDLSTMERRAIKSAAAGDKSSAQALLNGPEYAYLQDVYSNGSNIFGQELAEIGDKRAADLDVRTLLETVGIGLGAVLLGATALSIRGRRRLQGALALTAAVARTDALTQLPNRRRFHEELEAALADGGRLGLDHALLLIDLDRFKAANDAYGHPAGDELLQGVAGRLRALGDERFIARLGGDEFAFILRCDPGGPDIQRVDPTAVADRIVSALTEPFVLAGGTVVQVGVSVGIGISHPGDGGPGELMHRADVALYRAKADGRGCCRVFEEGMDAHVRARALLEGDLRQAIAEDAIIPYFQPFAHIETGRAIGVEMLARWPHPARGMVPPAEFIPIAEDLGLIGVMTEQLLRRACRIAARWPADIGLACNISPVQLRDLDLPGSIAAILEETGFPAHRLEIELTEGALIGDLDLARTLLGRLKASGVRLVLDDFGTGYSSLRNLRSLPFDKIKIDRSFVAAIAEDPDAAKIVSAVLGLGQSLGLSIVAEGVETTEAAVRLRELGCDVAQGWLFGHPESAERIEAFLSEQRAERACLSVVA